MQQNRLPEIRHLPRPFHLEAFEGQRTHAQEKEAHIRPIGPEVWTIGPSAVRRGAASADGAAALPLPHRTLGGAGGGDDAKRLLVGMRGVIRFEGCGEQHVRAQAAGGLGLELERDVGTVDGKRGR